MRSEITSSQGKCFLKGFRVIFQGSNHCFPSLILLLLLDCFRVVFELLLRSLSDNSEMHQTVSRHTQTCVDTRTHISLRAIVRERECVCACARRVQHQFEIKIKNNLWL